MKLPPYPKYKPSGVEWIADVPEHWDVKALGRQVRFAGGATPDKGKPEFWDGDIPWVSPKDMKRMRISDVPDHLSVEGVAHSNLTVFPANSILIVVRGMILAHSFPVAITVVPVTINQDMKAITAGKDLAPQFLLWAMAGLAHVFVSLADESAHGTRKLESEIIARISIAVPPLDEQHAIEKFIDRETATIDRLIAKKRTLIERLKEKRTALISRTVTRGLPSDAARAAGLEPYPKLKPTGIDWLGDVPEHWDVSQVRRFCTIRDCMHRTVSFVDDGIPLASIREVHGFEVDLSNAKQTTEDEYLSLLDGGRQPRLGDIIYSRNATVGDAAIVATNERFAMGQDVCLVRSRRHDPKYLLYLLRSEPLLQQLESFMIGATFRRINVGQIKTFWICSPGLSEQRAIAKFLDGEGAKTDRMIENVETAIDRLQEYRSALITAAVTGKIDVRNTEAEEPVMRSAR